MSAAVWVIVYRWRANRPGARRWQIGVVTASDSDQVRLKWEDLKDDFLQKSWDYELLYRSDDNLGEPLASDGMEAVR